MKKKKVSNAAIRRIPRYYRHLEALERKGIARISSAKLAMRMGLTSSQIRHDLASFGEFGQMGYGYSVSELMKEVAGILGMDNCYTAVLVGGGCLGQTLLANFPFARYGIHLSAVYDIAPGMMGKTPFGVAVRYVSDLEADLAIKPADIGILTAPVGSARELAAILENSGVKGIWNFTNDELKLKDPDIVVEDVHLFDSLFSLCCAINERDARKVSNY